MTHQQHNSRRTGVTVVQAYKLRTDLDQPSHQWDTGARSAWCRSSGTLLTADHSIAVDVYTQLIGYSTDIRRDEGGWCPEQTHHPDLRHSAVEHNTQWGYSRERHNTERHIVDWPLGDLQDLVDQHRLLLLTGVWHAFLHHIAVHTTHSVKSSVTAIYSCSIYVEENAGGSGLITATHPKNLQQGVGQGMLPEEMHVTWKKVGRLRQPVPGKFYEVGKSATEFRWIRPPSIVGCFAALKTSSPHPPLTATTR